MFFFGVLFCFYLFLSWVCDIDTIMSTYRDEDPRIHGIKTKIRVVPNFPKQGSSCDFLSSLCLLAEKMWEMNILQPQKQNKKENTKLRVVQLSALMEVGFHFSFVETMAHESVKFTKKFLPQRIKVKIFYISFNFFSSLFLKFPGYHIKGLFVFFLCFFLFFGFIWVHIFVFCFFFNGKWTK